MVKKLMSLFQGGLFLVFLVTCLKNEQPNQESKKKTSQTAPVRTAQRLEKKDFLVCGVLLSLEIADSREEQSIGLMYRENVPEGHGMIFVYPYPQKMSFWMRNVSFDIDIAFFNESGKFLNFHTMKGTSVMEEDAALPSYSSKGKALYAVEVTKGFFSKIKNLETCTLKAHRP